MLQDVCGSECANFINHRVYNLKTLAKLRISQIENPGKIKIRETRERHRNQTQEHLIIQKYQALIT